MNDWTRLLECILEDRNRYYENYEYGPFNLIVGKGVDLDARYSPVQDITVGERIAMIGEGEGYQFRVTVDRNFDFAYLMEPVNPRLM